MASCSKPSHLMMALLTLFVTSSMVLADHPPDGSNNTSFLGRQHHGDHAQFLTASQLIQTDHEPLHALVPLTWDSHSETPSVTPVNLPQLREPGNSIPKVINRPGTPEDYSYFKLKDVPDDSLSNGTSRYQKYIPVFPITKALLNVTNDDITEKIVSPNAYYDAPTQDNIPLNPTNEVAPGAIFFPQDPLQTHSSYSVVPSSSYPTETPSEGVHGEEPYNGFLATWWKTGSFLGAGAGQTSHVWKSFTKSVGTKAAKKWKGFTDGIGKKVAKKSKKILFKAAPIIKKVIGAKAVASLIQGAGINKAKIVGVGSPGVETVAEHRVPLATSEAPFAERKPGEAEVIKTSYSTPTQASQPTYGVPPQAPQPTYGAPSQVPQSTNDALPQIFSPLVLPALPEQRYEAPLPAQPQIVHVPVHQEEHFAYIPPQASHLFRYQAKKEEQSDGQSNSKTPVGVFGIVNGMDVKNNIFSNIYQYGRNLTEQAALTLSSLWPGNWFRSTGGVAQAASSPIGSQYGTPSVEFHYSATAPAPLPAIASVPAPAPLPAIASVHATAALPAIASVPAPALLTTNDVGHSYGTPADQ